MNLVPSLIKTFFVIIYVESNLTLWSSPIMNSGELFITSTKQMVFKNLAKLWYQKFAKTNANFLIPFLSLVNHSVTMCN